MKTIHKFPLDSKATKVFPIPHDFEINVPAGAEFLSIQLQDGVATIWAKVNTDHPLLPWRVFIFGTGMEMPDDPGKFLGTIQHGHLVWHYYLKVG